MELEKKVNVYDNDINREQKCVYHLTDHLTEEAYWIRCLQLNIA